MRVKARLPWPRRKVVAIAILLVGFGAALAIYLTAHPAPFNPLGEPEDSKPYLREMEVYGGKANLLAAGLRKWLESLWHGKRLAATVVVLTLVALLVYWIATTPLPPRVGSSAPRGEGRDRAP